MTGTAGWLLLAGTALFLTAAFAPVSFVFGIDPAQRGAFLARRARSWRWVQVPFGGGALLSSVGVVVLGLQLPDAPGAVVLTAGVLAVLSSLPWAEHCRLRAKDAAAFLEGRLPGWHFQVYAGGTLVALAATGLAVLHTDLPGWSGWFVLVASGVLTLAWLVLRDVPPFLFYLVTGVLGAAAL